jgi:hypothetical protein
VSQRQRPDYIGSPGTKRYLRANITVANAVMSAFASCTIAEANQ